MQNDEVTDLLEFGLGLAIELIDVDRVETGIRE